MIRKGKAENERKIVQEIKTDNEKCFQSVRAMRSVKESIRPLRHCKGNLLPENISKCNVCCGWVLTKGGQGTYATGGHKFPQGGRRNMAKGEGVRLTQDCLVTFEDWQTVSGWDIN